MSLRLPEAVNVCWFYCTNCHLPVFLFNGCTDTDALLAIYVHNLVMHP